MTRFLSIVTLAGLLSAAAVLAAPLEPRAGNDYINNAQGYIHVIGKDASGKAYDQPAGIGSTELQINKINYGWTLREVATASADGKTPALVLIQASPLSCLSAHLPTGKSSIVIDACYTESDKTGSELSDLKNRQLWSAKVAGDNKIQLTLAGKPSKGVPARPVVDVKPSGNVHLTTESKGEHLYLIVNH